MGIEHQFVFFVNIIKNRHLAVSDDNQLLLLIRMKSGDKDMGFHSTGKGQQADRDIGDPIMQVSSPLGVYLLWHLSDETQDHRYIMRGKRPQNILFSPEFSEVEPIR